LKLNETNETLKREYFGGVIFGIPSAIKDSKLESIEALRHQ
jgi:hypothetical protein